MRVSPTAMRAFAAAGGLRPTDRAGPAVAVAGAGAHINSVTSVLHGWNLVHRTRSRVVSALPERR